MIGEILSAARRLVD